jgi:hypothetical protein
MVQEVARQIAISDFTLYRLLSRGQITGLRQYMPGLRRLSWYVSVAEARYYSTLSRAERQRLSRMRKWTVRELMEQLP